MEQDTSAALAADDGKGIPADMVEADAPATEGDAPDPVAETERAFALRMGWRDKDEHVAKGRPEHAWLDAKSYIEKQQREGPLLRAQLRKQDETIARQEKLLKEMGEATKELLDRSRGAEERGFAFAVQRIDAAMTEAVRNADEQTFERLKIEREDLLKIKPAAKEAKKPDDAGDRRTPDPEVLAWTEQNPWFFSDKKLKGIARGIEEALLEDEPHLNTRDRLAKVTEEVKRLYPTKFENAARNNPAAAARPGPQGARPISGTKKVATFDDIPAGERESAKAAFAMIKRRTPNVSVEQYVKDYRK